MKSLDRSTKLIGVFVIALGVYSFFLPMVIVDPPVMDRAQWSALDIARNIYEKKLPVRGGVLDWGPGGLLDMALIYVLMTLSVIALYLPGPPKLLRTFGGIGFVAGFEAKWWSSTFLWLFGYFGHMQHWHMTRGITWWVLPWVMPMLLLISFSGTRDGRQATTTPGPEGEANELLQPSNE